MKKPFLTRLSRLLLPIPLLLFYGCASVQGPGDPRDPWEGMNRAIFNFNEGFYNYILDPVTETYQDITPQPVQTGVSNFFSNLDDIFVIINDLLQFKFEQAAADLSRFVFNSTFGLFGLIDVASHMDLPKHHEDFGQTLASWGVGDGPYLVLPFLGPYTLRDTGGLLVDSSYDPILEIDDDEARWGVIALKAVDTRAGLLKADRIAEQSGIDKYNFIRDAYMQHRLNLIHDGNPPRQGPPPVDDQESLELELELEKALETNPSAKP